MKDQGWSVQYLDKSAQAVIGFWDRGFDAHCRGTATFPARFMALVNKTHDYGKALDSGVQPLIEQTRVAFAEALREWLDSGSNNLTVRDKALLELRETLRRCQP